MKYINTRMADRIKELSDKGRRNYTEGGGRTVMMDGKYRGELGSHGVCVNGLTDQEIQELRSYNYFTTQEHWDMQKAGEWGTPITLSNGREYMM